MDTNYINYLLKLSRGATDALPLTVAISDMEKELQDATLLFKDKQLNVEIYDQICRGLLLLDEKLGYENLDIHRMGMEVFWVLMEAYQSRRKRLNNKLLLKIHGATHLL